MKKNIIFICLLTFAFVFTSCGGADKNGWYNDFESAKKVASSKNKNILLFVNSDYDVTDSEEGVKAITSTPDFTKSLEKDFICVHFEFVDLQTVMEGPGVDSTNEEQKLAEKKKALLQKQFMTADRYAVQETPAIVLISKEGYYISNVECGYSNSNVEGYVGAVNAEKDEIQNFKERLELTKKGSNLEKVQAIDDFISSYPETMRINMLDLSQKLISLDKNNESGLVGKHLYAIANAEVYQLLIQNKLSEVVKVYLKYATHKRMTAEYAQSLYFMAAAATARSGAADYDIVTDLLTKAIQADPESESVPQIQSILDKVLEEQANDAALKENAQEEGTTEVSEEYTEESLTDSE